MEIIWNDQEDLPDSMTCVHITELSINKLVLVANLNIVVCGIFDLLSQFVACQ